MFNSVLAQSADKMSQEIPNGWFPKVLVSSTYPFNTQTGGGITLRSLFQGWPADRLAVIFKAGLEPDLSLTSDNFALDTGVPAVSQPLIYQFLRAAYFTVGKAEAWAFGARLTPRLKRFVNKFRPDIIFTQLGSLPQISLAARLAEFSGAP